MRREILHQLYKTLRKNLIDSIYYFKKLTKFERQKREFNSKDGADRFVFGADYFCLNEASDQIPFDPHYFYHPAWAARVLKTINPQRHVDISSIFSFSGFISAFWNTEYYEFQPISTNLQGLSTGRVDLCALPFESNSITSLSCMHVIEHVGLGRYGDPIDPNGDIKSAKELIRVLAHGGDFLFVTPMAEHARIEYNAHRVYSYDLVVKLFKELEIVEFSIISDDASLGLLRHVDPVSLLGQRYACGCFHFRKP